MAEPLTVNGVRYVRIRPVTKPIGMGYSIRMFRVTNTRDQKRIGHDHLSRSAAAAWVEQQGWRYIGHQEDARRG